MKHYKVCKYDYENKNYQNEWSSIWDILDVDDLGKVIPGAYLDVEKKYLNFAVGFFNSFGIKDIFISDIEDNRTPETENDLRFLDYGLLGSLNSDVPSLEGGSVSFMDAIYIMQLSLRGVLWAKFVHSSGSYIAFGHDYYWLVGVLGEFNIKDLAVENGLFVYECSDPWE